ncbi:hypothetical protein [uncultured Desulfosarcina sp.]|uniref:hypothetical protein n=1 Tax=uncultured Desulfosarcina sp. TaxID=218289 RepID=UPI0029C6DF6D|nr:hypothetical protein [uncultured Desulfosarcina sp.]
MKRGITVILAGFLIFATVNCSGLFGPSDEDVKNAIDAAVKGMMTVPFSEKLHTDQFIYSNTADLYDANADETITQDVTVSLDTEARYLTFEGVCSFYDFVDAASGNTINGQINYQFEGSVKKGANDFQMVFEFDLAFEGGKVESIAFIFDENFNDPAYRPEILVNGSAYTFKEEAMRDTFRAMRSMNIL